MGAYLICPDHAPPGANRPFRQGQTNALHIGGHMKLFGVFSAPWGKITDRCDALIASCSRPYIASACGTSIALACLNPNSATVAIPTAGAVVMAYMGARSYEKGVQIKGELEAKRI